MQVSVHAIDGLERIQRWGHSATLLMREESLWSVLVFGGYGMDLSGDGPKRLGDTLLLKIRRKENGTFCSEIIALTACGPCVRTLLF